MGDVIPVRFIECTEKYERIKRISAAYKHYPSVDNASPRPIEWDEKTGFAFVALHNYPEYTDQCCRLLNLEWPRSRGARMNSLWSCNRKFPVALILLNRETQEVLGHCKLSKVPTEPTACFIESVVIHPDYRGKGIGTYLMQKVEHYVCSRKLSILYLSTMGQEKFYQKLGYDECGPISLYGFGNKIGLKMELTARNSSDKLKPQKTISSTTSKEEKVGITEPSKPSSYQQNGPSPPSPPPPPPPPKKLLGQEVMVKKTFMKKVLPVPCSHEHKGTSQT